MGASTSKTRQEYAQDVVQRSLENCKNTTTNQVDIKGLKFQPAAACTNSTFEIDQAISMDAECTLQALQDSTADLIQASSANVKADLGFSVVDDKNKISQRLQQLNEQACANASSNIVNAQDLTIQSCDFRIVQNATGKQACMIRNSQELLDKVAQNSNVTSSGGSISSWLFGSWGKWLLIAIAGLVVLGLVIGLIKSLSSNKNKVPMMYGMPNIPSVPSLPGAQPPIGLPPLTGGNGGSHMPLVWIILGVLILVAILAYSFHQTRQPPSAKKIAAIQNADALTEHYHSIEVENAHKYYDYRDNDDVTTPIYQRIIRMGDNKIPGAPAENKTMWMEHNNSSSHRDWRDQFNHICQK